MYKRLLVSIIFFTSLNICGVAQTKNIVITEKTYKKLTAPGVNHIKLAKNADKRKGIVRVKDSPQERFMFNKLITQNPLTKELPSSFRERELQFFKNNRKNLQSSYKSENIDWEQTGPYNVGGRTRALAIDINNNQIFLAGGVSGGIWKTEDGGESWTKTTVANEHQSVTAVVQDPREGYTNIWYYSTGELVGSSTSATGAFYAGAGIFKSTDGGNTWSKFADTDRFDTPYFRELLDICWNMSIDPTNGDLFVATYGGIYKYNFGEETRNFVLNSAPAENDNYSTITDVLCTPAGIKYATLSSGGTVNGIFRSVSGNADEWTEITPEGFPTNFSRTVLTHAPSNENILYFLSNTPDAGYQDNSLWKLSMNGDVATWENRSENLPEKGTEDSDVDGFNSQGSYNMIIKVSPDNENMVFIGGTNLHRSNNGFATNDETFWIGGYATANNISGYYNQHADQHSLAFFNDGKTLICGHDGGLSKTDDYKKSDTDGTPVDWTSLNNGYLTTQAYTVGIDASTFKSLDIISGFQDNGSWLTTMEDDGTHSKNWTDVGTGDGGYCSLHDSKDAYIISAQRGITYLYANDSWTRVDPDGVDSDDLIFINPYEIDPNEESLMYFAGGTHIWRNSNIYDIPKSSNLPATTGWTQINSSTVSGSISTIKSSILPENILYFGTSKGRIYKIEEAHALQPNTIDITGSNMPDGYVNSIEVNPDDANEIFVTFSNYEIESIFHSIDGGTSWTAVTGNLEITTNNDDGSTNSIGPSVRYVSYVNAESGPIYFAGTSIGLYSTNELNENTQWTQVSSNLIGNTVVSMVKTRKDGFIVVGTHGNGIYSARVDPATGNVAIAENDMNSDTGKMKIYPNPMVNESRIEFPNENNNRYRLVVIDASGRIVRIIENITNNNVTINREQLKPGLHIINLEGEKIYKGKLLVK